MCTRAWGSLRPAAELDEIPFKHDGFIYGVFDQRDEDGIAVLLTAEAPAGQADDVREAAAICPALAITIDGEQP